ncbi:pancreatic lipase-related protein 2 [Bombyx mori]|uniref:Lipase domain-containing protein n=1 Tax=Bombyx mori TaxID=7091 RepID=A0A8R2GBC5_BOMMO|nr:pancreatic lipase-related protein 2 [Bombyx mori]
MCRHRVIVLIAVHFMVMAQGATLNTVRRSEPELSFVENIYVRLSGACRAIMDLSHSVSLTQVDMIRTLKIIQLDGSTMRTFPINEAFVNLTKPAMFDITKQVKIIIHGYKDSSQSAVPLELAKSYNSKGMFNVFLVDAEDMMNKRYITCVHNARLIGKRLANLLANLENFGANADDFHLLGISLGAHIAGWAGKYFRLYKRRSIGRITGLDPAGPCFSHAYSDQRLDKSDALYVDVLHSNRLVQGIIEPLGHADFYINGGGPNQPGCMMPSCSHLRAAQVYTESVTTPKSFVGIRCQSWKHFEANACEKNMYAVLGYGSSTTSRGLYYLRTSGSPPFGLGMEGTKIVGPTFESWLRTLNIA